MGKNRKFIIFATIFVLIAMIVMVMFRKNIYRFYIRKKSNIVITFNDSTASQRYYYIDEKNNTVYYVDVINFLKDDIVIVKGDISDEKIEALKKYENQESPYEGLPPDGSGSFSIRYKDTHRTIERYKIMSFDLDDEISDEYKKRKD